MNEHTTPMSGAAGALSGLKVLDLGHAVAGPLCAALLADHGADVLKVEAPGGDHARAVGPFPGDPSQTRFGAVFQYANRNKKAIALDLKSPAGVEVFMRLVEQADVLIENFRAGVMERLGLDYEVLARRNPRLVYTSIRGFGDTRNGRNAYTDWPAVDIVGQAMGGLMSITGPDADSPMQAGAVPGDTMPGLYAAFATISAVLEARRSGRGQYVDVAMVDTILALNEPVVTSYSMTGQVPRPSGSQLANIVPFGRVRAKDGWAVLAVPPGRNWAVFCKLIDRPDLAVDERFATDKARVRHAAEVYAFVESFTRQHSLADLQELLGPHIPFAPVYDARQIADDPYFRGRGMLVEVDHPGTERKVTLAGVPAKLSRTPGSIRHGAPLLGEHTLQTLADLGYSQAEIRQLLDAGVAVQETAEPAAK